MTTETTTAQEATPAAPATAAASTTTTTSTAAPDDAAALQAQLEKERAERKAANAEAQKHRKALREIQEKALAEAGKFKELAEARAKEIEARDQELEQLRAKTQTYEQREAEAQKQREAQVAAEFAALPEEARAEVPADADLRTKEFAVRMYQRLSGKKPLPAPAVAATAPAAAPPTAAPAKPPKPTAAEMQELGYTRDPKRKAEIKAKVAAWQAHVAAHPEDT